MVPIIIGLGALFLLSRGGSKGEPPPQNPTKPHAVSELHAGAEIEGDRDAIPASEVGA